MGSMSARLRRLEETARGGACPECGLPPDGPNYTIDRGEVVPENPDQECPRCGRRLWWVCEIEMPKAEERWRTFAEEAMRRGRELLDENRAAVRLPPLGPEWEREQARAFGLEGGGGMIPNG